MFDCQLRHNYMDEQQIFKQCIDDDDDIFTYDTVDGEIIPIKVYKEKGKRCEKYIKRADDLMDVIIRDHEVMMYEWEATNWAVVILQNNVYQGHIYTWISLEDPSLCFAMGIRERVDRLFDENPLRNLSSYLFEAVRRFAIYHGCTSIVVPFPLTVMANILPTLRFNNVPIDSSLLGTSLASAFIHGKSMCESCYVNNDLHIPLVDLLTHILYESH